MEFGTRYETVTAAVEILERELGITMQARHVEYVGEVYSWDSDLGAKKGVRYYGITIRPTRYEVENVLGSFLADPRWEPYSFVIDVSDELGGEIQCIRDLVAQGVLAAREVPGPTDEACSN